ncbi:uncharacterized protein [Cherax quadricarinatus]|uniref:uncharacterized protein n=1 Tax=Cherax quadricarinatus TaxID=27406 RepID=UPI00387ECA8F
MAQETFVLVSVVATSLAHAVSTPPQKTPHQNTPPQYAQPQPVKKNLASVERTPRTIPSYGPSIKNTPAKYDFSYAVKDDFNGASFGHQETRNGYDTHGSFYVPLPDGRIQKVTYYVNGDSGYIAEVTYEGKATYPSYPSPVVYSSGPSYRSVPKDESTLPYDTDSTDV